MKTEKKTQTENENQHQILQIFFHTQMRKYLQKPTQNYQTIFRKSLYSFLVSTFTLHFQNHFRNPIQTFLGDR